MLASAVLVTVRLSVTRALKTFRQKTVAGGGAGVCFLLKWGFFVCFFCGVEGERFCAPINKMQSTAFFLSL